MMQQSHFNWVSTNFYDFFQSSPLPVASHPHCLWPVIPIACGCFFPIIQWNESIIWPWEVDVRSEGPRAAGSLNRRPASFLGQTKPHLTAQFMIFSSRAFNAAPCFWVKIYSFGWKFFEILTEIAMKKTEKRFFLSIKTSSPFWKHPFIFQNDSMWGECPPIINV